MQKQSMRMFWILVPVAVVLGMVVASWLRKPAGGPVVQEITASPLLESGREIDASLTGLKNSAGQPVDDKQFDGRYRLVAFGFTSCPDICPTMLQGVRLALQQLGPDAAQLAPIFISVDPERDTADKVGTYVTAFDSRITGLTGDTPTLDRVAKNYMASYAKRSLGEGEGAYTIDHTAMIYLIDPQQRIRALIPTSEGPQQVAKEIVEAYRAIKPAAVAGAAESKIELVSAWARGTPPAAPVSAAYLELRNTGQEMDHLIAVETAGSGRVEIHSTTVKEGVMSMNKLGRLELPPDQTVKMAPGGLHIMLFDLKEPLVAGSTLQLTLKFEKAPAMTVSAKIAPIGATAPPGDTGN